VPSDDFFRLHLRRMQDWNDRRPQYNYGQDADDALHTLEHSPTQFHLCTSPVALEVQRATQRTSQVMMPTLCRQGLTEKSRPRIQGADGGL
jgi:hypothetical protein